MYIHRWDEDGHPMPDKVTMVSKVTMLPKELAGELSYMYIVYVKMSISSLLNVYKDDSTDSRTQAKQ